MRRSRQGGRYIKIKVIIYIIPDAEALLIKVLMIVDIKQTSTNMLNTLM